MPKNREVYLLDPKDLTPETIAVTFAKTSRSPESFREIAKELTEEKSAEFNEKWVVGYGHSSVAEHAILHLAVENLSRLAVESLESARLASYTEKSTRYQKWDPTEYFFPEELSSHPLEAEFRSTVEFLFERYLAALPKVQAVVAAENPQRSDESAAAWERRIRSKYVDVCRFYLPAAALANVGVTVNARELEHMISKMLSHSLAEVQALGTELKAVSQANVPTLVKYANPDPYLQQVHGRFEQPPAQSNAYSDWCQLVSYDKQTESKILAAVLYRNSNTDFKSLLSHVDSLGLEEKQLLAGKLMDGVGKFTSPIRELEYGTFTFDLIMDQGAYFEFKRHRMMTLTPQPLTANLGYATPLKLQQAGLEQDYETAMEQARAAYSKLAAWNPEVASYIVPNGFNRRSLIEINLRSALHLVNLRSASNAHFSMRRVAQRMAEELRGVLPILAPYFRANLAETWQQVEQENFVQV